MASCFPLPIVIFRSSLWSLVVESPTLPDVFFREAALRVAASCISKGYSTIKSEMSISRPDIADE